ncbi:MAG: (2Fe-2S) ferredoxin domain-containing protein [Aristaeellaceae bacterium]
MVKVSICTGMSCSMYGSSDTRMALQKALKQAGVAAQVEVSDTFCMGECANGPCVRINGVKHRHMDPDSVATLVQEEILPLVNG